jgi:hypothetical protein
MPRCRIIIHKVTAGYMPHIAGLYSADGDVVSNKEVGQDVISVFARNSHDMADGVFPPCFSRHEPSRVSYRDGGVGERLQSVFAHHFFFWTILYSGRAVRIAVWEKARVG